MDQASLYDTIRRLLALSSSPNEHEAAAAMAKAQQLLLEHGLRIENVSQEDDQQGRWQERWVGEWRVKRFAHYAVADIVQSFFFVRVIYERDRLFKRTAILLFGTPEHTAVALHVFTYLLRTFDACWTRYREATRSGQIRQRPYLLGLTKGIKRSLALQRRESADRGDGRALVLVEDAIAKAFEMHLGKARTVRVTRPIADDVAAEIAGFEDGRRIRIDPAVGAEPRPQLLFDKNG
jgi:hypothetical protein